MNILYHKQRRIFLACMTVLGAGIFPKSAVCKVISNSKTVQAEVAGNLSAAFGNRRSLNNLGRAYFKQTGSCQNAVFSVNALCARLGVTAGQLSRMPAQSLRAVLKEAVTADYAHGRVVRLQSWILSESEVQACAIVASHDMYDDGYPV